MKQVVETLKPTEEVLVSDASSEKYYGIVRKIDPYDKAFVSRTEYVETDQEKSPFRIYCPNSLTKGNSICGHNEIYSLKVLLEGLVDQFDVYEFDTPQELFTWLAK